MSDGANLGYNAKDAMYAIVGGKELPPPESPEEVNKRVRNAPTPLDSKEIPEFDYAAICDSIAHSFLQMEERDPGILTRDSFYPDDYEYEPLRGQKREAGTVVWEALKEIIGEDLFDAWFGGITGFQFGFSVNLARNLLALPPVQNPAIITFEV